MSSKLKSGLLLVTALILFGILAYLLKDVTKGTPQKSSLYDAKYYNDKGNALIMKEKFNDAIEDFNKAIEISKNTPQYYVSYTGRASAKYNLKDCNGTISDANIAILAKDLPSEARGDMLNLIGMCEYMNSNYKDSVEHLTMAISLTPKNSKFSWMNYLYRGASETELNDYIHAKEDLLYALKLDKNEYITYNYLYIYYIKIEDYKTALKYFEKRGEFTDGIDSNYYQNGVSIYLKLIAGKQGTDPDKINLYKKLAFEHGTKAYKMNPNAINQYKLCISEIYLNDETTMNKNCYEARNKAKNEKNEDLYKVINDAINSHVK